MVDLVLKVFGQFVAPGFSDEGVLEFKKFVSESELSKRFEAGNPIVVAEHGKMPVGVIEIRDDSHIALLFVEKAYQKRGIAGRLIHEAVGICRGRNRDLRKFTVNASPNAYDAYRHMGFRGEKAVSTINGIRFIPMELELGDGV